MTSDNIDEVRWAEFQVELLRSEECLTMVNAVALCGDDVSRWLEDGAIFSVPHREEMCVPSFQFSDNAPVPIIRQVLALMRPKASNWEIFAWFTQSNSWSCRGRKPKDLLLSDPDAVVEAARHDVAEQWF